MIWIKISAAEEKKWRTLTKNSVAAELVAKIDEARAAEKKPAEDRPRMSWLGIIQAFRKQLGDRVVYPPNPTRGYISSIVNRVNRLGIDERTIEEICRPLVELRATDPDGQSVVITGRPVHNPKATNRHLPRRFQRDYYDLEWLLYRATELLQLGKETPKED